MGEFGRLAAIGVLLLGAAGGCVRLPQDVQLAERFAAKGTVYGDALLRDTRKAQLYQGVDTVAIVWATWRTPELRLALAQASAQAYGLEKEKAEPLRKAAEAPAQQVREFHLAVYTPKKQWNDLESPNTLWRLHLELPDGTRLEPLQATYLTKTEKSSVEYPYVSPWTREYSVLFPLLERGAAEGRGTLVMAGPLGTVRLDF